METSTDTITVKYRKIYQGRYEVMANGHVIGQVRKFGRYTWDACPADNPGQYLPEDTRKAATACLLNKANIGTFEDRRAWREAHNA